MVKPQPLGCIYMIDNIKWVASSRLLFASNVACCSIETTTIMKTQPRYMTLKPFKWDGIIYL